MVLDLSDNYVLYLKSCGHFRRPDSVKCSVYVGFFSTWFVNKLNSETQPEPIKAQISLDFSSHFSAAVQESLLSIQD